MTNLLETTAVFNHADPPRTFLEYSGGGSLGVVEPSRQQ